MDSEWIKIAVEPETVVSGRLLLPPRARACFLFAHGAGAGMAHPFMESLAQRLVDRGIGSLRYQFPYMERSARRPDPAPLCHATVRAAAAHARQRAGSLPLVAGGKSFGGRMTSQAQSIAPIDGVLGLAFLGFPLHPAGHRSTTRAAHLSKIDIPLLFIQGAKDKLADPSLLESVVLGLGPSATLLSVPNADHSLHVPKKSGTSDSVVLDEAATAFARWVDTLPGASSSH